MCHYPDLGSASDWFKQISLAANKSELGSDTSLDKVWNFYARSRHHCAGKPVMVSRNVGCSLKLDDDRHHPLNFWARTYYSIRSNYLFKKL